MDENYEWNHSKGSFFASEKLDHLIKYIFLSLQFVNVESARTHYLNENKFGFYGKESRQCHWFTLSLGVYDHSCWFIRFDAYFHCSSQPIIALSRTFRCSSGIFQPMMVSPRGKPCLKFSLVIGVSQKTRISICEVAVLVSHFKFSLKNWGTLSLRIYNDFFHLSRIFYENFETLCSSTVLQKIELTSEILNRWNFC